MANIAKFEETLVLKGKTAGVPLLLDNAAAFPPLFDNGMQVFLASANTLLSFPLMEDFSSDDVLPEFDCDMEEMPFQWAAV